MGERETDAQRAHLATVSGREAQFNTDLGANVRRVRNAAGLTQDELASKVGVTRGSIANLERGVQAPSAYRLLTMAEALRCQVADLVPEPNGALSGRIHELSDSHQRDVALVLESMGRHV